MTAGFGGTGLGLGLVVTAIEGAKEPVACVPALVPVVVKLVVCMSVGASVSGGSENASVNSTLSPSASSLMMPFNFEGSTAAKSRCS